MKLKRTSVPRAASTRILRIAAAAALATTMWLQPATPAFAVSYPRVYEGINNPANTSVDLFDYWITSQNADDRDGANAGYYNNTFVNQGINQNHALIFHGGAGGLHPNDCAADIFTEQIGAYGTASQVWGPVAQGLVTNTLDGGYPRLNGQYTYTFSNPFDTIDHSDYLPGSTKHNSFDRFVLRNSASDPNESLAYLFDPTVPTSGKASYTGVNGLFSVDSKGYYVYDSDRQAADYNPDTNRFDLSPQSGRGFWPLDDESSGQHNDYSGMHMQMSFSMPAGGAVLNPQGQYEPMTFTFAGDDDVWVYVDGVLVGDVGGIHQPSSLQINFQTGAVQVNRNFDGVYNVQNERGAGNPEYVPDTTIRACYEAAGRAGTTSWNGNTFADGTYHTIDFFYLERGNNESNLVIRFNMINTADFTAHKALVSDNDEPLGHDRFQFELVGLDGLYRRDPETGAVTVLDAEADALKPRDADTHTDPNAGAAAGDVSRYFHDEGDRWVYRVGAAADGNVNFGNADFGHVGDGVELGDSYRYQIREVATPGSEYEGDERVYYMEATIAYDSDSQEHYLSKRYYTDDTYTTRLTNTNYASFVNLKGDVAKATPTLSVSKDLKQGETALPIAAGQFSFEAVGPTGDVVACGASDPSSGVATATLTLGRITPVDFEGVSGDIELTYTVREVIPADAVDNGDGTYTLGGITYHQVAYTVTIPAHYDKGANTMSVGDPVYAYPDGSTAEALAFHNTVDPVEVSVLKRWDDSAAGTTIAHPAVTFRVVLEGEEEAATLTDGTPADDVTIPADPEGDDSAETRTASWDNLPAMDEQGNALSYTVVEVAGAVGYQAGEVTRVGDTGFAFELTNTLKPLYLQIRKLAGPQGQETEPLPGAGFTLTRLDPEADPLEGYAAEDERHYEQSESTDTDGLARFGGEPALMPGTYRVAETTVPAGYQKAADIVVSIAADGTATVGENAVSYDAETRTLSIEITDTELPDLPATGGPGDTAQTVSGAVMIGFALALLYGCAALYGSPSRRLVP